MRRLLPLLVWVIGASLADRSYAEYDCGYLHDFEESNPVCTEVKWLRCVRYDDDDFSERVVERHLICNPESLEGHRYMAGFAFARGDYTRALDFIDKAAELTDEVYVLEARAKVYAAMKKYKLALSNLEGAIEAFPEDTGPLTQRAIVYQDLGLYDEGLADLERSVQLRPHWHRRALRAMYAEEIGYFETALEDWLLTLHLMPDLHLASPELRLTSQKLSAVCQTRFALRTDLNEGEHSRELLLGRIASLSETEVRELALEWVANGCPATIFVPETGDQK